jgi:hypothetical protein
VPLRQATVAGTSNPEFQLKVFLWVPQSQAQFSIRISVRARVCSSYRRPAGSHISLNVVDVYQVYFENSFSLASNRLVGTCSIDLAELWGLDEQVAHPPRYRARRVD